MNNMEYRLMNINDYDQVYQLWINCKGMGLNDLDDCKQGIEKFLKRNPTTCFVCTKDEKIVGAILTGHDGRRGYIYHLAVDERYRKRGIGRTLVDKAMDALKEEGINKVGLVVFSRNEDGNKFWKKIGFTSRDDLTYRDKNIIELKRFDT